MKRILIGVAVAGIGVAIAFGVRSGPVPQGVEAEPAVETVARGMGMNGATAPGPRAAETDDALAEAGGAEVVEPVDVEAPRPSSSPVQPSGNVSVDDEGAREVADAAPAPAVRSDVDAAGPDVEEVLRAASAAYEAIRSLRAEFVMHTQNPLLRNEVVSRGTLFQRRPDRFLMRFSDPDGDVIVSDGEHIWIYYPSTDARQVVRTPAGVGGASGVDLQAQFLGDPVARFDATLEGRESVNSRPAHRVRMIPREYVGYKELTVWIDVEDQLARRFEITEESGVVRRIDLDALQVNESLSDDLFDFTPPSDARVIDRG